MDRELGHVVSLRLPALLGMMVLVMAVACGGGDGSEPECADVIDVNVVTGDEGTITLAVTVRSDDVGWEGYADRWEVLADGVIIGERVLTHPHVEEQPFTRSQAGIAFGQGTVIVRAHHSTGGYCGEQVELSID